MPALLPFFVLGIFAIVLAVYLANQRSWPSTTFAVLLAVAIFGFMAFYVAPNECDKTVAITPPAPPVGVK